MSLKDKPEKYPFKLDGGNEALEMIL